MISRQPARTDDAEGKPAVRRRVGERRRQQSEPVRGEGVGGTARQIEEQQVGERAECADGAEAAELEQRIRRDPADTFEVLERG